MVNNSKSLKIKIDIWSDSVCPYCYAGMRVLEKAIKMLDIEEHTEIVWHSYQLNPSFPKEGYVKYHEYIANMLDLTIEEAIERGKKLSKMGEIAGIRYNLSDAKIFNTFYAHRLLQKSKELGKANILEESLFKAFFSDGSNLNNIAELTKVAISAGLTDSDVKDAINNQKYHELVWKDFREADSRKIEMVPTFFIGNTQIVAVPEIEEFVKALEKAMGELPLKTY